jgi:hypothetical protein
LPNADQLPINNKDAHPVGDRQVRLHIFHEFNMVFLDFPRNALILRDAMTRGQPLRASTTNADAGRGVKPARMPVQRTEEWLADEERKQYTLKNGQQIEGRRGCLALLDLKGLLEQSPQFFRALLAIVQGRLEDASPEAVAYLKDCGYLRADTGAVRADIPDVLLSAYQETPEGPVLVNPFKFNSTDEAREVEQSEKTSIDWLIRELRKDGGKGPSPLRE